MEDLTESLNKCTISKRKTKLQLFEEIFNPDQNGCTRIINISEIINCEKLTWNEGNGNCRKGNPPWDYGGKYKWKIERKNNKSRGKVISIQAIGINKNKEETHPINKEIRKKFNEIHKNCLNCGTHRNLVIDHKNDLYNEKRVLNIENQKSEDFQRLCDKCNNDLKHSVHEKEIKSGKLHKAKDIGKFLRDKFEYPWEKCLRDYKDKDDKGEKIWIEEERHCCKYYTYWYDIETFENRREWYIMLRKVNKQIIKNRIL